MRASEAYELLSLTDQATPAQVREAWRQLRSTQHPDKGGDADAFIRYREAYLTAIADAQKPQRCERCEGSGRVLVVRGFSRTSLRCSLCGGTGQTWREGAEPHEEEEHEDL